MECEINVKLITMLHLNCLGLLGSGEMGPMNRWKSGAVLQVTSFFYSHPRGVVLSESRFSLAQVSEPEPRTEKLHWSWFSWLLQCLGKGPPSAQREEADSALWRWERACIWESGPAASALL